MLTNFFKTMAEWRGATWCVDQFFHWFKDGWENRLKWYEILLLGVGCVCGVLSRL